MKKEKTMENGRGIALVCVILFAILVFIENASAIGLTPARTTADFESNLEKTVAFTIINSDSQDMDIKIFARGELADYVTIDGEQSFSMSSRDKSREVRYTVRLPKDLAPGLHTAEVVAMQLPADSTGQTSIKAAVGVATQLYVRVAYPEKYLEGEIKTSGDESQKNFFVEIVNRGKEDISEVSADLHIFDPDGNEVESLETNKIPLESLARKELAASWDPSGKIGKYTLKAVLNYDGKEMLLEKEFTVGRINISSREIFVENFHLGDIAKFNIVVENRWNELLKNVHADLNIRDQQLNSIDTIRTPSYDLFPGAKTTIVTYWDTKNIKEGTYYTKMILYFAGEQKEENIELHVTKDKITVLKSGYAVTEINNPGKDISINKVFTIVITFLILSNVIWFLLIKRILKKRKK